MSKIRARRRKAPILEALGMPDSLRLINPVAAIAGQIVARQRHDRSGGRIVRCPKGLVDRRFRQRRRILLIFH
jgi:hypothetical protein